MAVTEFHGDRQIRDGTIDKDDLNSTLQTEIDAKAVGPASSTDNAIARFDSTTGKLLQNSEAVLDDDANLSIVPGVPGPGKGVFTALSVATNEITERSAGSGVDIDGVRIKDNGIAVPSGNGLESITGGLTVNATSGDLTLTAGVASSIILNANSGNVDFSTNNITNVGDVDGLNIGALDTDLETFTLPASTTISTFGASLIDDAAASDARTTLGLGTLSTANNINNGNWSGTDLSVANGGTGRSTSTTAYGLIAAGTTATGAHQTIAPGTSGHFLKSAGTGALASFAAVTKSDINLGNVDNTSDATKYTAIANGLYPVGTHYYNETNSANPSTYLLGASGQTWVAIEDVFIVARGSTYTGTGGSATHTHPLSSNGQAQVEITSSGNALGNFVATSSWTSNFRLSATSGINVAGRTVGAELAGATDSGDNIPPYQAVYAWKRTA